MYQGLGIIYQYRKNNIPRAIVLLRRTPATGGRVAVRLERQKHPGGKGNVSCAHGFQPCPDWENSKPL